MKKRARKTRKLETAFNAVATPVFLLDARRTVLFFNAGCEELTGWPAADVVGAVCDYVTSSNPAEVSAVTGRLAPPPDVLHGRETGVATEFLRRDGKRVTRMVQFAPLMDRDNKLRAVLGTIVPLRDPERTVAASPARQLHAELAALRVTLKQRFGTGTLIGRSPAMQRALRQVEIAAASRAGVHIRGASGSGREHVARSIHLQSALGNRSFVPLDCSRLPAHELKQAISRAVDAASEAPAAGTAAGLQPGTLYFANVEALPRDLQQLVVDSQAQPAAGVASGRLRIVASTLGNIDDLHRQEQFVDEFFYLLTALRIELPPLSRRGDDLLLLGQAFLEDLNRSSDKQIGGCGDEVWRLFRRYNWPANLDELRQVISQAHESCTGDLIQPADLPFRFRAGLDAQAVGPSVEPQTLPLQERLDAFEADQIRNVLEQTRYNKTRAAALLGMPRPRLYRRMEALGIEDLEEK